MNDDLEFDNSEMDALLDLSLFNYCYLDNTQVFLSNLISYFGRKYADGIELPLNKIQLCLEKFYQRVLNMEDYQLNERFLKKVHEIAFLSDTLDESGTIDLKIMEFFESSRIEALRGLAVAVIIAVLLQRHGFFIGSFTTNSSSSSCSDLLTSELYDRVRIYDDFRAWTNIYDPENLIQNEFTEYARLVRFYHINRIIFNLFEKGSRLKGMYLFVGACLEGIPDGIGRLYVIGGHMTESTQRRESIFETITGVQKGRRNLIPK